MRVLPTLICLVALTAPLLAEEKTPEELYKVSRLQGTVQIDRRNPVAGATVKVKRNEAAEMLYLTSTDRSGRFRVDGLPNGEYVMTLQRQGLVTVVKEAIQVKYPFRALVEITMQPTEKQDVPPSVYTTNNEPAEILATISDLKGKPLAEVAVRAVRPDGSEAPRSLRTDQEGHFSMEQLAAGPWRLEIRGAGFLWLTTVLELDGKTELQISLVPQPPGYVPTPNELMPGERPIPPTDLLRSKS